MNLPPLQEMFHKLLDETSDVKLTSTWKEVKKLIKEDPRYTKFSSSDRKREREFTNFLSEKVVRAKTDYRELLKETKLITHKSKKILEENDCQHLKDIEKILQVRAGSLTLRALMGRDPAGEGRVANPQGADGEGSCR